MNTNKDLTIEEAFNLAVKNHQKGKTYIAQELYNKVLEIDPNHSQALNNLGIIFQDLGGNQKAKDCYEKAIEINPNYTNAYYNLGIIFQKLIDLQKAKECYEKAIEIDPNYTDAHNNLGNILKELGENQKAKSCYEKAIEIDPNRANTHNNLGAILRELGEKQKAKECFEKAIEIDPNYAHAHNNLGLVFVELGEFEKAKNCCEKAIEIDPNYAHAHNNLGVIFKKLGELEKAKECFEKAIEIDPNHADAHNNLGVIFKELGEFEKGLDYVEKAVEIDPDYANAQDNLRFFVDKQRVLSEIEKAQKPENKNKINFIKKIRKKIFGTDLRLKTNPFISYRTVEEELISCLYKMNNKSFKETNDIFFGNGEHSENFKIFQKNFSILKKVENELTVIMKQAVKSDIFICDSFYNILRDSNEGGSIWHTHLDDWDTSHGLQHQKYSLTYHVAIGNQKSSKPGFLCFKDPDKEILPSEGMVMIFPADRSHSAIYNGKIDRIMLGVNFYSLT